MKRIILLLLLIPTISFGQDPWLSNDKIQHWTTSTVMSFAGGQILEHMTGWEYSHEAALFGVIVIGTIKEYRIDEKASAKDIAFNAAGAVAGYYLNRAINRKIRKWKLI